MSEPWRIEAPSEDDYVGVAPTALASLSFLRSELRRRRRTWIAWAAAGLLMAVVYMLHSPTPPTATVTLTLQHPAGSDPTSAMQTDMVILNTRRVSELTAAALGEDVSPEQFAKRFAATATTSTVLTLTATGHSDADAVRTVQTLADTYLDFRGKQLRQQADAQIAGYEHQVADLTKKQQAANSQYQRLKGDPTEAAAAAAALTNANSYASQVGQLQQNIQDAQADPNAVIRASGVLDPAAVKQFSTKRHVVLTAASGLVAGTGIGVGLVVFSALTSTRLRRRDDVAAAVDAPVTFSARRLRPSRLSRLLPRAARGSAGADDGLAVLAHGLETALVRPGANHLALVAVDGGQDAAQVAALVAAHLAKDRRGLMLVDLTERGELQHAVQGELASVSGPAMAPLVHRPEGVPALARGPLAPEQGEPCRDGEPWLSVWESADLTLTIADFDLDIGADELSTWADRVVLLVIGGRSTGERLRTTADLLRSAGLLVESVLMLGTDSTDESNGHLPERLDVSGTAQQKVFR